MKKVYLLFASVLTAFTSMAQYIPNPGMDTWRTGTSGGFPSGPAVPIEAPDYWYGFDSVIVAYGELYGALAGFGNDWHQQVFQEGGFKLGGAASAKLITVQQDSVGLIAGVLSSAHMDLNISALIGGAGSPTDAIIFTGGIATTLRPVTVSAWVAYFPGIDTSTGLPSSDEGLLTVQAVGTHGGADTVIGTGTVNIPASATFTQITANLTYSTHGVDVDRVRIIFASSGGSGAPADSSTLYVDGVEMTCETQGVDKMGAANNLIKVFPNPATGTVYMSGPINPGYNVTLSSVSGQVVATQAMTGNDKLDISALPAGIYLYSITDAAGAAVQKGKVNVVK